MVRRSFYLSLVFLLSLLPTTDTTFGQSKTADESQATGIDAPVQLNAKINLIPKAFSRPGTFQGTVILEPIDVGKAVTVSLDIINTTDTRLTYAKATTSCSCTSFTLSSKEFPPGSTVSAELKIKVQNGNEDGINNYPVRFTDESGNDIGYISCVVPATNRLFVGDSSYGVLDIDKGIVEYKIPIIYSEPIRFENLSVAMPEDAFDKVEITTTLEKNDKHSAFLFLRLDSDSLTDAVSVGTVKVIDSVSLKTAEKTFYLRRQLPIEVLPNELQFIDIKEKDLVRATAIVRAFPQKNEEEKEKESHQNGTHIKDSSPSLSIAVSSKGTRLPIKVVQLGSGLARVTIEVSLKESNELRNLDWDIKVGNVTYQYKTKVNVQ